MSQRISGYPRQPNETYETPSWVVQVVAQYLRKHCLHIWAPADEESSRLVLALRAEGFTVTATADDFLVRTAVRPGRQISLPVYRPCAGIGADRSDVAAYRLRFRQDPHQSIPRLPGLRAQDRAARSHCLVR